MGRYAKENSGSGFTPAPEGTHLARCIRLIDLGTQKNEYQGKISFREEVVVQWELPNETIDTESGPQPMIVSKFYTISLNEKANLRADLESWRGRAFTPDELGGFDLEAVLNAPAMVNVVHNEAGRARVRGVMKVPRGTECPKAHNTPSAFWLDPWDDEAFAALPEGFQKIIQRSSEWADLNAGGGPTANPQHGPRDDDNDIPF